MLLDDPSRLRTDGTGSQYVFIFFDRKDLATHKTCHADPVEYSKYDKQGNHVAADLIQKGSLNNRCQYFL